MFLMQKTQAKTTLSPLYGNIQRLSKISFMTCHIISRGYNDAKGYVKLRWFDRHFPDHEIVAEIDNPNSFMRLIDLKRKGMQSEDTTTLD